MEAINQNPELVAALVASLLINAFEQIVPHLPTKANSSLQFIIQVVKAMAKGKK